MNGLRVPTVRVSDADPIAMLRAMYLDSVREGRAQIALKLAYVAAIEERDKDKPNDRPRYRSRVGG